MKRYKEKLDKAHCHAIGLGGKCLSNEYIGVMDQLRWQCAESHCWNANYNNVINNGTWCKKCSFSKLGQYNKLSLLKVKEIAHLNNGECLSVEYISARVPMQWKCANGHIFENALCNIKAGSWCPKCINKTENQVRKIFEEIFNKKFESVRPDFLKNPQTGSNLELDGFCEELKIAFEYDGEWHYMEHFASNIPLEKRKELDLLKSELCQVNGVTLYRIPFTAKSILREFIYSLVKYHKMEEEIKAGNHD